MEKTNEQRGGIRKLGEKNQKVPYPDAFLFPTWRKQLGPFQRPLLGAGRLRRGRKNSFLLWVPRKFPPGSTSLLCSPSSFSSRERREQDGTSHLCLCDPCTPGYALLNGTEGGAGQPARVHWHVVGLKGTFVCVCSLMFYPVSTHTCACACHACTCTLCNSTERRLTCGFLRR